MTEKVQDQKKVIKPSKWTLAQGWRKVEPSEIGKAEEARLYLLRLRFYPSGVISNDPGWDRAEVNDRYALHQMIDELPVRICKRFLNCTGLWWRSPKERRRQHKSRRRGTMIS